MWVVPTTARWRYYTSFRHAGCAWFERVRWVLDVIARSLLHDLFPCNNIPPALQIGCAWDAVYIKRQWRSRTGTHSVLNGALPHEGLISLRHCTWVQAGQDRRVLKGMPDGNNRNKKTGVVWFTQFVVTARCAHMRTYGRFLMRVIASHHADDMHASTYRWMYVCMLYVMHVTRTSRTGPLPHCCIVTPPSKRICTDCVLSTRCIGP